jgi:hypothetical protein
VVVSTSVSYLSSNFKEKVVLDIADRLAFGHGEADGELAGRERRESTRVRGTCDCLARAICSG